MGVRWVGRREGGRKGKEEERKRTSSNAPIIETTMDEEQIAQKAELTNRVVAVVDGLLPFQPKDAHPDVCGLEHGHVVRAVTYCVG